MKSTLKSVSAQFLKKESSPVPWATMILCCVATTFPLVIGLHNGQLGVSIYGALTGYLLTLNDHLGTLKERIQILTLTFIMMIAGFAAGFFLHDRPLEFVLVVGSVTYWMGILGGNGAELERAVLFTVILIIISFFSIRISPESLAPLFSYALLAYGCLMVAIPILIKLKARAPEAVVSLRSSFRQSLSKQREKHIHAASYTLVTIFSIWLVQHFNIERGYWIIITVLLVMRPDRSHSIYRTFQRLIGTAAGVLFYEFAMQMPLNSTVLTAWVMLCAFIIPYTLKRNYFYASFFVTTFVVALLEIAIVSQGTAQPDATMAFLRLKATLAGCILSILGTVVSKALASIHEPQSKQN